MFMENGDAVPVTAVAAGPCYVTAVKTTEKDGYTAVQIGYGKAKRLTKALAGHLQNLPQVRHLREFRLDSVEGIEKGSVISVRTFAPGDKVTVVGTSKGRGFQGVVKRHGFGGSPASHGHKDQLRMPGSVGATDPARVFKGKKMGGHMGDAQVTVANLEVISVDEENNLLYLKGAVPGARGTFLQVRAMGDIVFDTQEVIDEKKSDQEIVEDVKTEEATEVAVEKSDDTAESAQADEKSDTNIEDQKNQN